MKNLVKESQNLLEKTNKQKTKTKTKQTTKKKDKNKTLNIPLVKSYLGFRGFTTMIIIMLYCVLLYIYLLRLA